MAPADPAPHESSDSAGNAALTPASLHAPEQAPASPSASEALPSSEPEPVSQEELNAWRRGLTPQAEIWNGRLAMLGLSTGLLVLLLARLAQHHG